MSPGVPGSVGTSGVPPVPAMFTHVAADDTGTFVAARHPAVVTARSPVRRPAVYPGSSAALTVATQIRPATFASRTGFGHDPSARCCTICATDADGVAVDAGNSPCNADRNADPPVLAWSAMYWSNFANATSFCGGSATVPPFPGMPMSPRGGRTRGEGQIREENTTTGSPFASIRGTPPPTRTASPDTQISPELSR